MLSHGVAVKFCNTKYYYLNARPCSATALMLAADSLIAAGEMSYVQQYLWTGDKNKYNGGAIKYDLDYVITNYNTNTCDLWEEIRDSDLFWNRATMKKAMILGASFASKMG